MARAFSAAPEPNAGEGDGKQGAQRAERDGQEERAPHAAAPVILRRDTHGGDAEVDEGILLHPRLDTRRDPRVQLLGQARNTDFPGLHPDDVEDVPSAFLPSVADTHVRLLLPGSPGAEPVRR